MSMNNWEQAEEWYKLVLDSRYSDTARGMLDLLPLLRQQPDFKKLEFGTSLLEFFYVLPKNGRWLFVIWQKPVFIGFYWIGVQKIVIRRIIMVKRL